MNASEKVNFISNWIKDYANNMPSKAQSLVIGISGGIDSALTSTLCASTGLPTICIDMPIMQNKNEVNRASSHIKWLQKKFNNVIRKSVDLNDVFNSFKNTVEQNNDKNKISINKINEHVMSCRTNELFKE